MVIVSLAETKIASAFVLFFIALGGGLAPLRSARLKSLDGLGTSIVNAFAGGVLLAASIVHMLPDSLEATESLGMSLAIAVRGDAASEAFPVAPTVAGLAFLGLYVAEALTTRLLYARHAEADVHGKTTHLLPKSCPESPGGNELPRQQMEGEQCAGSCCSAWELQRSGNSSGAQALAAATADNPASACALLAALVVHSILEGVGIGVQSDPSMVTAVFFAAAAHKGMAAFALGIQLRRFVSDHGGVVAIVIFSLCSPAGIALGAWVRHFTTNGITGLVLALAAGTFFYVAVPELLVPAIENGGSKKPRELVILSALVGFLGMSGLAFWT